MGFLDFVMLLICYLSRVVVWFSFLIIPVRLIKLKFFAVCDLDQFTCQGSRFNTVSCIFQRY